MNSLTPHCSKKVVLFQQKLFAAFLWENCSKSRGKFPGKNLAQVFSFSKEENTTICQLIFRKTLQNTCRRLLLISRRWFYVVYFLFVVYIKYAWTGYQYSLAIQEILSNQFLCYYQVMKSMVIIWMISISKRVTSILETSKVKWALSAALGKISR